MRKILQKTKSVKSNIHDETWGDMFSRSLMEIGNLYNFQNIANLMD